MNFDEFERVKYKRNILFDCFSSTVSRHYENITG